MQSVIFAIQMMSNSKKKIVLFASGSGSNAENIVQYFAPLNNITISVLYCNVAHAVVIKRMKRLGIPTEIITKHSLHHSNNLLRKLKELKPDLIVLAGFLWKIPLPIVSSFTNKIINIHPSLLPKYGGKGMYGQKVHEAVIRSKENKSGITIHYVNEDYDKGAIIFQKETVVSSNDTPETLADKIHELEFKYFPTTIHQLLTL